MPYIHKPEERQRELDMILDESRWPNAPFLPIKRYPSKDPKNPMPDTATVAVNPTGGYVMWKEDCWTLAAAFRMNRPIALSGKFESAEAILDDGWVVD